MVGLNIGVCNKFRLGDYLTRVVCGNYAVGRGVGGGQVARRHPVGCGGWFPGEPEREAGAPGPGHGL